VNAVRSTWTRQQTIPALLGTKVLQPYRYQLPGSLEARLRREVDELASLRRVCTRGAVYVVADLPATLVVAVPPNTFQNGPATALSASWREEIRRTAHYAKQRGIDLRITVLS
jgi:hypothetical protein